MYSNIYLTTFEKCTPTLIKLTKSLAPMKRRKLSSKFLFVDAFEDLSLMWLTAAGGPVSILSIHLALTSYHASNVSLFSLNYSQG